MLRELRKKEREGVEQSSKSEKETERKKKGKKRKLKTHLRK